MSLHDWKESFFDTSGTYQGMRTCVQEWKCRACNTTIELPFGVKPTDYDQTICKGVSHDDKTDTRPVHGTQVPGGVRMQSRNVNSHNRNGVRNL